MALADCTRRDFAKLAGASLLVPGLRGMQQKPSPSLSSLLDGSGLVSIPAGEFQMGSMTGNPDEQPVHRVRITRPFEIAKHEVTQAQWESVMRDAHMKPEIKTNFSHFQGADLPVESVTWDDVIDFLDRLNARDDTHQWRLPTEAEWEYAALGGAGRRSAPNPASLSASAWYETDSGKQTQPVGTKAPGPGGLYDMFGNVAEWVQDWYARDYYAQSPVDDPQGPETGSYRVYRGGCWFDPAKNLRAAYRGFDLPANKVYNVGFRVVRTPRKP